MPTQDCGYTVRAESDLRSLVCRIMEVGKVVDTTYN
jgi:hypothetical protein